MRTLHRYVFTQVLAVSSMTVGLFAFVLIVGNVLKEVMPQVSAGRIDLGFFLYIIAMLIPKVITYALPLGMLSSILVVFGRMSAQSEIVAIKASGQSIFSLAAPVFLLTIIATFASIVINFYYSPIAEAKYKADLVNIIRNAPLKFINEGAFIKDFPGYVIYANEKEGDCLYDLRIWEFSDRGHIKSAYVAKRGELSFDAEKEIIQLKTFEAVREERKPPLLDDNAPYEQEIVATANSFEAVLPLNKILGSFKPNKKKLGLLTLDELIQRRNLYRDGKSELAYEGAPKLDEKQSYAMQIKVQLHIQKEFSIAFSIFSLVLLAIPLGIKASRSETFANLGIALVLAMGYYMSTVIISWFEVNPHLRPDILIWIPNIIFQIVGIALLIRANKA
ncbi:MAG: LptF/LptG family permease [Opitutales bacterium]